MSKHNKNDKQLQGENIGIPDNDDEDDHDNDDDDGDVDDEYDYNKDDKDFQNEKTKKSDNDDKKDNIDLQEENTQIVDNRDDKEFQDKNTIERILGRNKNNGTEQELKWQKNKNNINVSKDDTRIPGDGKESEPLEEEEEERKQDPANRARFNELFIHAANVAAFSHSDITIGFGAHHEPQINNEARLDDLEKKLDRIPEQISNTFGEWRRENHNFHEKLSQKVERRDKLHEEFSQQVQDALDKIELKLSLHTSTNKFDDHGDKHFDRSEICVGIDCPCPCRHKVNERGPRRKKEKGPKKAKRIAMAAGGGGDGDDDDDGSSDGSSREDDNEKPSAIPKDDPWEDAIKSEDEECIASLLSKGKMPSYKQLKLALTIFQRTSNVVKEICDHICTCISRETRNIISVVPSYDLERPEDIVFVVYIRTHSQNDICFKDFLVVTRVVNQYSSEGKDIATIEDGDNLAFSEYEMKRIETSTTKFTEELFRNHSNLQMISPSQYRSYAYEKDNPKTEMNLCIALYVTAKGYIPLAEKVFPKFLNGVPTDVREGGFEFYSKANEWHKNIKMGCEISGDLGRTGTMGPFIEQNGFLYFFTSAHVLCNLNEISMDSAFHTWETKEVAGGPSNNVYQPEPQSYPALGVGQSKPIGKTCCAFYKKGDNRTPGMEVAVVEVTDTDRKPLSGHFPDSDDPMETSEDNTDKESDQKLVYESGVIIENEFIINNFGRPFHVTKFGAESGKTSSCVNDFFSSVRGYLCDNDGKIVLYNQIIISEKHDGVEFAKPGDSGALVLASIGGDVRALGLLVGRSSTGRVLATPMYAILDELKANFGLTNRNLMAFTRQTTSQISTDSGASSVSLPDVLDYIHQDISQQVAQHNTELGGKLRAEMTNEIGDVKKEIDVVKRRVRNINEKVSNIDTNVKDLSSNVSNMMSMLERFLR